MQLPSFQTNDRSFSLLQTAWASIINPFISRSQNESLILTNLSLASGQNTVFHTLNKTLTGWRIVRQRGAASFYDNQDSNTTPALTLLLVASASVSVDLEVF